MTQGPVSDEFDPDYFWNFATFMVLNSKCQFRLPTHRFKEGSEWFATEYHSSFECTTSDPAGPVIELDVDIDDFRAFLKALYPLGAHCTQLYLLKDEWISVLRLSTKWHFNDLRKLAIDNLTSTLVMDPIERITLAKEFHVEAWLCSGLEDLVSRKAPISTEEAKQINWEMAIELCAIRETRLLDSEKNISHRPRAIRVKIENVFADMLYDIRSASWEFRTRAEKALEAVKMERRVSGAEARDAEEERRRAADEESRKIRDAEEEEGE